MNKKILILGLTLLGAIAIITAFSLLAKKQEPPPDTDYIEQLARPSRPAPAAEEGQSAAAEAITFQGKLAAIAGNKITIIETLTGLNRYFLMDAATSLTYGGKSLATADLYAGDALTVTADRAADGAWLAKIIVVTLATSPTVPTPVNLDPATPGVILPPSKRTIL